MTAAPVPASSCCDLAYLDEQPPNNRITVASKHSFTFSPADFLEIQIKVEVEVKICKIFGRKPATGQTVA